MSLKNFRLSTIILSSSLFLASVANADVIEKTFDADPGDTLTVNTDAGSIRVETQWMG